MPKITIDLVERGTNVNVSLWRISESEEELLSQKPFLQQYVVEMENMKSSARRLEYLVTRALLYDAVGEAGRIFHYPTGKPYLQDGRNISISHTKGYAAIAVSKEYNVALDMEYVSDRVCRVADKFLRSDENAETTLQKLLVWCAKETLYKLHSEDNLTFHEMRVENVPEVKEHDFGELYIENIRRNRQVKVTFLVTEGFILAFAKEKHAEMN